MPNAHATARMRAWRSLKSCGAAVIRDGVYALPDTPGQQAVLAAIAKEMQASGGTTWQWRADADADAEHLVSLFDRRDAFGELLAEIAQCRTLLAGPAPTDARKSARKLRRAFDHLSGIDFFPGEAQHQAELALRELEAALLQVFAPDEPRTAPGILVRKDPALYQGRLWATRRRPWVDRLASAWLIRRFIDRQARFVWLKAPADLPRKAVGFDFDGAEFTHTDGRVTYENLLASFSLESPALLRIGLLVHCLDAGGVRPPEAAGVEHVLAGMHEAITNDDHLLLAAAGVFEGLLVSFEKESKT